MWPKKKSRFFSHSGKAFLKVSYSSSFVGFLGALVIFCSKRSRYYIVSIRVRAAGTTHLVHMIQVLFGIEFPTLFNVASDDSLRVQTLDKQ